MWVKYGYLNFQIAFEMKINRYFFRRCDFHSDYIPSALCKKYTGSRMDSVVQQLAEKINMSFDEFVGEMRKRGCSEPTAIKIWRGEYENFTSFSDNDMSLSNLRKAADVLKVGTGRLLPK